MAAVGNNFHRVIQANPVTAADLAAGLGWVALNLDLASGQSAYITSLDLLIAVTGADYTNLQFVQLIIIKNINMNPGLSFAPQLGAGTEQLYNIFAGIMPDRAVHREWASPFPLEGPGRYTIFGQAFFSAFVGPTNYTLNVQGRVAPSQGAPDFPLVQR
jgi:hypothetical protein